MDAATPAYRPLKVLFRFKFIVSARLIARYACADDGDDMPSFRVAHIREQGQDMLLFPLDRSFGYKTDDDQSEILSELEERAHGAGLAGRAVAVWEAGGGTRFLGPRPWHGFLQSINMRFVLHRVNRSICW